LAPPPQNLDVVAPAMPPVSFLFTLNSDFGLKKIFLLRLLLPFLFLLLYLLLFLLLSLLWLLLLLLLCLALLFLTLPLLLSLF
jgi:hypothetical protein